MGQRSSGATVAAIYQAFLRHRTWKQAELARHAGVSVPALRARLQELRDEGMPLDDERDGAHVYWSVPASWFPGGVGLQQEDAVALVHELWRLPKTKTRKRLLQSVLTGLPSRERDRVAAAAEGIVVPAIPDAEAEYLRTVEDALAGRTTLRMKYFSAHSSDLSARDVSVHRLLPGPPARFVATCHRSGGLKWFRVDGITTCSLEPATPFRDAEPTLLHDYMAASADGFHADEDTAEHVFFVHEPESRWVRRNLFPPMSAEEVAGGIRVSARTAGALRIARFVVSLGAAARPETEPLRALVLELAQGASRNATQTSRPKTISDADVNKRAVASIQARK